MSSEEICCPFEAKSVEKVALYERMLQDFSNLDHIEENNEKEINKKLLTFKDDLKSDQIDLQEVLENFLEYVSDILAKFSKKIPYMTLVIIKDVIFSLSLRKLIDYKDTDVRDEEVSVGFANCRDESVKLVQVLNDETKKYLSNYDRHSFILIQKLVLAQNLSAQFGEFYDIMSLQFSSFTDDFFYYFNQRKYMMIESFPDDTYFFWTNIKDLELSLPENDSHIELFEHYEIGQLTPLLKNAFTDIKSNYNNKIDKDEYTIVQFLTIMASFINFLVHRFDVKIIGADGNADNHVEEENIFKLLEEGHFCFTRILFVEYFDAEYSIIEECLKLISRDCKALIESKKFNQEISTTVKKMLTLAALINAAMVKWIYSETLSAAHMKTYKFQFYTSFEISPHEPCKEEIRTNFRNSISKFSSYEDHLVGLSEGKCPSCSAKMNELDPSEVAVIMCGHIFCLKCIQDTFYPEDQEHGRSCPLCYTDTPYFIRGSSYSWVLKVPSTPEASI
jgi:hypothetical protein